MKDLIFLLYIILQKIDKHITEPDRINIKMVFPQSNTIYTFHEIINILQLSDSPFLQFAYNDTECIIQTSHVSDESLLNIPGMRESLWCFEKTTREAIPLFWYSDYNSDILKLVDIIDLGNERYLATPIGHPR